MLQPSTLREPPVYMDYHATTPLDPRVLDAMLPYFTGKFGNASSRSHQFGWDAEAAVEGARAQVAALIGAAPREIIFTSGATESDNLAIQGVAEALRNQGNHIITSAIEHRAVLDTCKMLEARGYQITRLPVQPDGRVDPAQARDAITGATILVSIMAANNEIGSLQPLAEIGSICRERGVLFHSDAVQALGKVPLDVNAAKLDLASLTAHKLYGPKGCGALYVRRGRLDEHIAPLIHGGGHERGLRSGTLNVPGIVGFGKACEIARREMREEARRLAELRDRLKDKILSALDGVSINGGVEHRLPGNLNLAFAGVEAEAVLTGLHDVAVSSGSACSSDKLEPSYVLRALGLDEDAASSSIRFGLGRFTTLEEVDHAASRVVEVIAGLRELVPSHDIEARERSWEKAR